VDPISPAQAAMAEPPHAFIRPATAADMLELNDLYNHYILTTPATFDIEPYTLNQRMEWFSHYAGSGPHRVLVADLGGTVVGATWSSQFRPKRAYETSVETSIYCAPGWTGKGLGRLLYTALFEALVGTPVHRALAAITLPNDASVALHLQFGYRQVALLSEVGKKFDRYWDVAWFERPLAYQ
jgi:phosphinothricin acetyltransferase